jgi:predicted esterase
MSEISEQNISQQISCYYDLYVPDGNQPKPLIIALHGYGGDKSSMMKLMRNINSDDYVLACLQGPHQHMILPPPKDKPGIGFGWLTNFKPEESVALHHRNISQIISELVERGVADARNIFLLGFSQAVGVNFRFAFTHSNLLRGVVAICGGIPGDWKTEGKYNCENLNVLYIGTAHDEFYTPEIIRNHSEALQTKAKSVEVEIFDDTHRVPRNSYQSINQWIKRQIQT